MIDETILKDFNRSIRQLSEIKEWIDKLYYDPEFSTLFNRPVLSMLSTACEYVFTNLIELKQKYITRKAG